MLRCNNHQQPRFSLGNERTSLPQLVHPGADGQQLWTPLLEKAYAKASHSTWSVLQTWYAMGCVDSFCWVAGTGLELIYFLIQKSFYLLCIFIVAIVQIPHCLLYHESWLFRACGSCRLQILSVGSSACFGPF